ncbi:AraC family transcriptional regulator [Pedobacter cryoconitis]|uniref:AraC-like DNA-binding protein n=1 Tax=Pedobacter cryoconitis TaxID=188932 RepID=A0A7X0J6Y3_9SPHI|nr:AraC family transcriptional regulator [Pedobacter cryoconitis]MBB6501960.1 AraC-like DNA-binding protein [Pedobacter cryoconitis]
MKPQFIGVSTPQQKNIYVKTVDKPVLNSPLHFHDLCELVWIEESYGKRIVGDSVADFKSGDLVLMGPNLPHIWHNDPVFHQSATDLRAKAVVVYFPVSFLMSLSDDDPTTLLLQNFLHQIKRGLKFQGNTRELLIDQIQQIRSTTGLKRTAIFLSMLNIMTDTCEYEFLTSNTFEASLNEIDNKRIHTLYVFLMENFSSEIFLKDVAQLVNLSPNAFCRFFKKHTRKPFSRFLNELRIAHACKLLPDKNLSIAYICYQCGYQNLTNFNKFFRLIMDCNPSTYRNRFK